jgi:hypothetical protein
MISKRVNFAGQQLWLVADEAFDDYQMALVRLEHCDRFGVPHPSTLAGQSFAAVVGNDIYREGVRIGARSEIL